MKDLSYTDFFGKNHTHKNVLSGKVLSYLMDIEMEENGVSEKAFKSVDLIRERMEVVAEENLDFAINLYNSGKRIRFIAESIWDRKLEEKNNIIMIKKFNELNSSDAEIDRSEWPDAPEISKLPSNGDKLSKLNSIYKEYHKMSKDDLVDEKTILNWIVDKGILDDFMANYGKFSGATKL